MASKVGLARLAEKIEEYNFHALLVIGGYEVSKDITSNAFYCQFV